MHTKIQEETVADSKTGTETGQKSAVRFKLPKTHQDYWASRLRKRTYETKGKTIEIPTWQVRITHLGKEAWFNLDTSNKIAAATKARDIYAHLLAHGWDATLAKFKPGMLVPKDGCTVGEFLSRIKAVGGLKPVTFEIYAKKFRSLVAGVFGIRGGTGDKDKFDYVHGGHDRWLDKISKVRLDRITPKRIETWKFKRLNGGGPVETRRTMITLNSIMRASKALFRAEILNNLALKLPTTLPFDGVKSPKIEKPWFRYKSEIDPAALLQAAVKELAKSKGDGADEKHEMFKIVVLSLGVGLRRDEIDTLQCRHILWQKNAIRVETTEFGETKTAESEGDVYVDPALLKLLKEFLPDPPFGNAFVVKSKVRPRSATTYHHYRCNRLFKKVNAWLKSKGITSARAIHALRKEFGSIVNSRAGIYAASKALRHASIQVTADHYLDQKIAAVFPVGELLADATTISLRQKKQRGQS